jgi:hypothetical protein
MCIVNEEHHLAGNFTTFNYISAFFGGEEVIDVKALEYYFTNTINTTYALNDTVWIPGDVEVNDRACAVDVDAFRKFVA